MKGKRLTALALAAMLVVSAVQPAFAADWQSGNKLIAHALGEVDNKIETNSFDKAFFETCRKRHFYRL